MLGLASPPRPLSFLRPDTIAPPSAPSYFIDRDRIRLEVAMTSMLDSSASTRRRRRHYLSEMPLSPHRPGFSSLMFGLMGARP